MKITEVRIFPVESRDGKLKAFATMTFDDWFVVRNVKVIQGNNGLFVAMPSRKAVDSCPKCKFKNARGSKYCNQCGSEISHRSAGGADDRQSAEHMDIAHPIKQECRMYIQEEILKAYTVEKEKQEKEGGSYKPQSETDLDEVSEGAASGADESAPREEKPGNLGEEGSQDIEL